MCEAVHDPETGPSPNARLHSLSMYVEKKKGRVHEIGWFRYNISLFHIGEDF
jgi:hypothetical protein